MRRAAPRLLMRDESDGRPAGWLELCDPREVLSTREPQEVAGLLRRAEEALARGLWVGGFLAYEAAPGLDTALETAPPGPLPVLWLGLFDAPTRRAALPRGGRCHLGPWRPTLEAAEHGAALAAIRQSIAEGDTYQVNFTLRMLSRFSGEPLALFLRLWRAQRGPLSAYLDLGRHVLCSASPELLFSPRGRASRLPTDEGDRAPRPRRGRGPAPRGGARVVREGAGREPHDRRHGAQRPGQDRTARDRPGARPLPGGALRLRAPDGLDGRGRDGRRLRRRDAGSVPRRLDHRSPPIEHDAPHPPPRGGPTGRLLRCDRLGCSRGSRPLLGGHPHRLARPSLGPRGVRHRRGASCGTPSRRGSTRSACSRRGF